MLSLAADPSCRGCFRDPSEAAMQSEASLYLSLAEKAEHLAAITFHRGASATHRRIAAGYRDRALIALNDSELLNRMAPEQTRS